VPCNLDSSDDAGAAKCIANGQHYLR